MTQGQEASISTATPEAAPSAEPAATAPVETPSQNGSANGQTAPAEDKFSNIDPETLPPELKGVYKNLQADYTRKTQSIAEARKKAQAYDQIVSRPDFKEYWSGLNGRQKAEFKEQKAEAEKRLGEKITDDEFRKAFDSKDEFLGFLERIVADRTERQQKRINELESYRSVMDANLIAQAFRDEAGPDGKPLRPDFESLEEDSLISGYLAVNPPTPGDQSAYVAKLNEAYGWAKALSQKYYEKGRADALKVAQTKAVNSTERPTTSAKGVYSGPDPKKLTPREALELAKKGIRVPRDD